MPSREVGIEKHMKIWHLGASSNPFKVDGVNHVIWNLARYQAILGNRVALLVAQEPEAWVKEWAEARQVRIHPISGNKVLFNPSESRTWFAVTHQT